RRPPSAALLPYTTLFRSANAIEIFVEDPERVWQIRRELDAVLGSGWSIVDWQQAHSSIVNALAVERNVMFIILSLIILVAAFNIDRKSTRLNSSHVSISY